MRNALAIVTVWILLITTGCGPRRVTRVTPVVLSQSPMLMFVGDETLTAGRGEAAYDFTGSNAVAYVSARALSFFPARNVNVSNRSEAGTDLNGIASVVEPLTLKSVMGPDLLVVQFPARDARKALETGVPVSVFAADYGAKAEKLLAAAAEKCGAVIVVLPFAFSRGEAESEHFAACRDALTAICAKLPRTRIADPQPEAEAANGNGTFAEGAETAASPRFQIGLAAKIIAAAGWAEPADDFVQARGPELSVVFTGDSITDAGRAKEFAPDMDLGNGYAAPVAAYLKARFAEAQRIGFYNSGVSGNTSAQLRARFRTDADRFEPDVLVMLIGINDAYLSRNAGDESHTPERYRENLTRIFEDYACDYAKVFLISPFLAEPNREDAFRIATEEYAKIARDIAARYDNVVFVDMQEEADRFMKTNADDGRLLSPDKVHLTPQGTLILAARLIEAMERELSP